jgi:cytochrome c peroxidase
MNLHAGFIRAFLPFALLVAHLACSSGSNPVVPNEEAALGRQLFFDTALSEPAGQSCASCHAPEKGFTDPRPGSSSEGVVPGLFGARNAPTAAYAAFSPAFAYDAAEGTYRGGQFLDGRASSLADQAQGPPLNPIEMHNPDRASYVAKLAQRPYAAQFQAKYGQGIFQDADRAFQRAAEAIAAFERSRECSPFSSKYDAYLQGTTALTAQERRGLALFEGRVGCAACHPSQPTADQPRPLFTDFTYDNLGVPRNPTNPFYTVPSSVNPAGQAFVDVGLAANPTVIAQGRALESRGKFKVPTLRNLALTGPYFHHGGFATLKDVVAFYNTRDSQPQRWGAPEIPENVNREELGNLGLSEAEEDALVAFLLTLTDGYQGRTP